jgi:hypothetical protein
LKLTQLRIVVTAAVKGTGRFAMLRPNDVKEIHRYIFLMLNTYRRMKEDGVLTDHQARMFQTLTRIEDCCKAVQVRIPVQYGGSGESTLSLWEILPQEKFAPGLIVGGFTFVDELLAQNLMNAIEDTSVRRDRQC